MKRVFFVLIKTDNFNHFKSFLEKSKLKEKFPDNLRQVFCRLFHFLVHFLLTTSQMEIHNYHHRVNVRFISRATKRLKT